MSGARLHARQVTTRAGLDLVRAAKARGVNVTAGVTPAHFMLSDLAMGDFRTFARLSPPLREEDDRQAVIEAIADGTIDVIASGHDPRGPEDKRLPFADAEPGMAGAETLLAMTLDAGARRRDRHGARLRPARPQSGAPAGRRGGHRWRRETRPISRCSIPRRRGSSIRARWRRRRATRRSTASRCRAG